MINSKGKQAINFYSKGKQVTRIYSRDKIAWEPFVHIPASILLGATAGTNILHLKSQANGFDCKVLWGDGKETIAPINGGDITHDYAAAGDYNIQITGKSFAGFNVNNQSGKEKYKALYSMGKWAKDTLTGFDKAFYGCTGLTTLPADLFAHNTAANSFNHTFDYCTGLTALPADLFAHNTAATFFDGTFSGCTGLTTLPADLFAHNTAAFAFTSTFQNCSRLILRNDIFGTDYVNRFSSVPAMYFGSCFLRMAFYGAKGTAPELWRFTFSEEPSSFNCFGGRGNDATSLSNYADIPADWLGW